MSHDPRLLFVQICIRLDQAPALSLLDLSRELQVGFSTIQNAVASMTGTKFSDFKDDILIARLTRLFLANPLSRIEEVSFELGYQSNRTFARAVRRACGLSPAEFHKRVISDLGIQKRTNLKISVMTH